MQNKQLLFYERLRAAQSDFHQVVNFDPKKDKLSSLDCTKENKELLEVDLTDTDAFSTYIDKTRHHQQSKFLIGGYNENRTLYNRSKLFDSQTKKDSNVKGNEKNVQPRTLHLGTDIWGEAGTKIFAPLGGRVHSFAFNNNFGDYGATIILLHQLDGFLFYTLYGHLSLQDLGGITEGKFVNRGECIAHFGTPPENGHWPPHLHFQVIIDMHNFKGDYPGVCALGEKDKYLEKHV